MNCVLYARVSTDKQAEKELSIPAQVEAMREHARREGWTVAETFLEPGASAKTADRPVLQQMLARIRRGDADINILLVHKIDRLARNVYDHATIRALLRQHGIRLASVVENVGESVSGELVENIMASIAQFYSANLSEEVKKGMRQRIVNGGWPHRPPRGYRIVKNATERRGVITVHPADGPLMKHAFELYATGWYSVQALANRLACDGLLGATGGPVAHAHLTRLLSNPFYAGRVTWHGEVFPGAHPPLVSPALFDTVQEVMRRRGQNPGPRGSVIPGFPLRGLATCASCRGRMTCERHGKWRYYRCSRQTFRRELCVARMCNAERAHADIERICRQVRINRDVAAQIAAAAAPLITERIERAHRERQTFDQQGRDLTREETGLAEAFSAGSLTPEAYRTHVEKVRSRRQQLLDLEMTPPPQASHLEAGVGRILQMAMTLWDLYSQMNEQRKAVLLKTVFSAVVLDHQGVAGYVLRPPFDAFVKSDSSPAQAATDILDAA